MMCKKKQFKEKGLEYEGDFLWRSDFDNYARISGVFWVKSNDNEKYG